MPNGTCTMSICNKVERTFGQNRVEHLSLSRARALFLGIIYANCSQHRLLSRNDDEPGSEDAENTHFLNARGL